MQKTAAMRYLCRVDDRSLHAYASTRRDFHLASDDTLWAHESHGWLLAAIVRDALRTSRRQHLLRRGHRSARVLRDERAAALNIGAMLPNVPSGIPLGKRRADRAVVSREAPGLLASSVSESESECRASCIACRVGSTKEMSTTCAARSPA